MKSEAEYQVWVKGDLKNALEEVVSKPGSFLPSWHWDINCLDEDEDGELGWIIRVVTDSGQLGEVTNLFPYKSSPGLVSRGQTWADVWETALKVLGRAIYSVVRTGITIKGQEQEVPRPMTAWEQLIGREKRPGERDGVISCSPEEIAKIDELIANPPVPTEGLKELLKTPYCLKCNSLVQNKHRQTCPDFRYASPAIKVEESSSVGVRVYPCPKCWNDMGSEGKESHKCPSRIPKPQDL